MTWEEKITKFRALAGEKIGHQLFLAMDATSALECEIADELMRCCELDPNGDGCGVDDVTFDSYDCSFEFKGVTVGWVPTQEQIKACLDLGFGRCWICYRDGSEMYASDNTPLTASKPPTVERKS